MNKYMVYDKLMIDGSWRTLVEPYNMEKIEFIEKLRGYESIKNLYVWEKDRAMEEWKERTNGTIFQPKEVKETKKKVPQRFRKCGNIHMAMDWKYKNGLI